ncbi:MAG: Rieske 2Fe-2S domain-containing protein [Deltaproteobacteria bacterium]|nr:Rieske 2Fe-2S domain-containing protein [Deltaproteobacteria bacterium]
MLQETAPQYDVLVKDDRVHATLYTDPRIFEEELERIFYRGWVFIGHESEIPRPGDFLTRAIGRQPVIFVREKDGSPSVLLNRCAHRGSTVCTVEQGNTKAFVCPYHGWTYDLGGNLLSVAHPGGFAQSFDKSKNGLARAARIDSYRGFVFACLQPTDVSLADHLGIATKLIDRACDLSPEGEIELTAGWIRHRYGANWKMLPENDTDGYHLTFTHASFIKSINSQYSLFAGNEKDVRAVLRDWGNGHTEIDWAPGYKRPFDWFGGGPEGKFARYLSAMEQRYGKEAAQKYTFDGPPHAIIFPNLFLAEMNIVIMQPVSVNECIHWHTPMFLKGVPEFNIRLLRQSEAAMGPASFLTADDATIASRNQVGLAARNPEWLDIGRGLHREEVDGEGRRVSHLTDETTNRAFWKHYRTVMSA